MSKVAFEQCFICCTETNSVGVDEEGGNGGLWKKFCVLVSRYLDLSSASVLYSQSRVLKASATENNNICDLCTEFVTSFCSNYEEWKNAELRLNWSLRRVTQIMKRAKVNDSSWSKSQSKPKCRRSRKANVVEFRRDLLVNYHLHRSREFPRLNLSKMNLDIDDHDHEQSEEANYNSEVNVKVEIPEFDDFDLKFEPDTEFVPDAAPDHSTEEGSSMVPSPISPCPSPGSPEPESLLIEGQGSRSKVESEVGVEPSRDHDDDEGAKKKSKCRYCGKAFNGRQKVFIHEFQHTGQKPFECAICSKRFNDPCACIRHLKGIHNEKDKTKIIVEDLEIAKIVFVGAHKNKSTVCSCCGRDFHTFRNRKRHELRLKRNMSKVNVPLICKFCGKEFNHLRYLRKHENVHMRAKLNKPKAPSPTKVKVNKNDFNKDEVKVTELIHTEKPENENLKDLNLEEKQLQPGPRGSKAKDPLLCKFCGKEFQVRRCLRRHEIRHEKGGLKPRGRKSKPPNTSERLNVNQIKIDVDVNTENEKVNEVEVNSETKVPKFKCQHCDKRFHQQRKQIYHELQHTDKMPFQCVLCSRKFKGPSSCLRHIKSIHKIEAPEDPKSQMLIESEEIGNQVFKRYQTDKSLICTFCGKTFETYQKRRHHEQRVHLQEKRQYQCSTCGKEVSSLRNLRRHEILHTGLRPFKCRKGCGKSFSDESTRKGHEDNGRHLEDGTFVRKFSDRVHLRKPGTKYRYRKRTKKPVIDQKGVTSNTVEAEADTKVNYYNQEEFFEQKVNLDAA